MTEPAVDISGLGLATKLQSLGVKVDGTKFSLKRYPYLIELFDGGSRFTTILKGGQMGFTSWLVLKFLAGAGSLPLRGVGIYFPSHKDAGDFARARVDPMLAQPAFAGLVQNTNTQGLKMVGETQMYMRGAGPLGGSSRGSKSPVKSIPLDWLGFDEMDEMQPSRVDAAEHRLDGSRCPEQTQLSTPTLPNFGVDLEYQDSDQRYWFWECTHCGKEVCLELEYPDCIALPTGEPAYYLCKHCRDPLERWYGRWVASKPDILDHRGYHVSQLCSPTRTAQDIVRAAVRADERGMPREFNNQVLAKAYAEIEDVLTKQLLDACLTNNARRLQAAGPTAMGVDVGRKKHAYWIKQRINSTDSETLTYGMAESFEEIHSLAMRFNVKVGVIDQQAEYHKVRQFVDAHLGWWGLQYVKSQPSGYNWDAEGRVVRVARTPALDASHQKILQCREHLPAADEVYAKIIVPQMCNLGRTQMEDPETGSITTTWVKLGKVKNDHMKHAHAAATVAEERAPLAGRVKRSRQGKHQWTRPDFLTL